MEVPTPPRACIAATPRYCQKTSVLLAELEQNLFKHQHGPRTSQDGERLPGKERVRDPGHGRSKQRLDCTLRRKKQKSGVHIPALEELAYRTDLAA